MTTSSKVLSVDKQHSDNEKAQQEDPYWFEVCCLGKIDFEIMILILFSLGLIMLAAFYPMEYWDWYMVGTPIGWITRSKFNCIQKVLKNQSAYHPRELVRIITFDLIRCLIGSVLFPLIFEGPAGFTPKKLSALAYNTLFVTCISIIG